MEKKKLGLLLSTPPSHPNITTVTRLSEEARSLNHDVYIYLIDEGVKSITDPQLLSLSRAGTKLFACAYGCQRHGVPTDTIASEITLCGLVVLSNILNGCDRFISFN